MFTYASDVDMKNRKIIFSFISLLVCVLISPREQYFNHSSVAIVKQLKPKAHSGFLKEHCFFENG